MRSLLAFAVVIAVQGLAGCEMPVRSGLASDERSARRMDEFQMRAARTRRQVEAGTFGLAQLYPGRAPIQARQLPPLPRPHAVAIPRVVKPSPPQMPEQVAFAVTADRPGGCVYKPIMSDADINACR